MELGFVYACLNGYLDIVRLLLARGVNISAQDGQGQSGLHYALLSGNIEMLRLLLAHGASLELQNMWGGSVLGQVTWGVRASWRFRRDLYPDRAT